MLSTISMLPPVTKTVINPEQGFISKISLSGSPKSSISFLSNGNSSTITVSAIKSQNFVNLVSKTNISSTVVNTLIQTHQAIKNVFTIGGITIAPPPEVPQGMSFTYTDGTVSRIDYDDGSYKEFTYNQGYLEQIDYIKGTDTLHSTLVYDTDDNLITIIRS